MQIILRKKTRDLINFLQGLPWLNNVGQCDDPSVKVVKILSDAKIHLHRQKFSGLLTEFVNYNQSIRCRNPEYANENAANANLRANLIGAASDALVDSLMARIPLFEKLDARLVLSNHIDGFITETEFDQKPQESPYRTHILPWYERGHLPCGWDGVLSSSVSDYSNWKLPKGRLRVF
ncbi:MAG: hypothetical protein SynsKO_38250 [Synoicihabitans sp.]